MHGDGVSMERLSLALVFNNSRGSIGQEMLTKSALRPDGIALHGLFEWLCTKVYGPCRFYAVLHPFCHKAFAFLRQ